MGLFGELEQKRAANARGLAAFGLKKPAIDGVRVIREGSGPAVYTIGYERRDGDELTSVLRGHGITALADVRERPTSRKADFRAAALQAFCANAGIEYQPWPSLGSTVEQREELQASGNFGNFRRRFREHADRVMRAHLDKLAESAKLKTTALLCYERLHEDCHRSVLAELVAERIDATILAIQ